MKCGRKRVCVSRFAKADRFFWLCPLRRPGHTDIPEAISMFSAQILASKQQFQLPGTGAS